MLKYFAPLVLLISLFITGCVPTERTSGNNKPSQSESSAFKNSFALPQQKAPPQSIQSIQLYRKGSIDSAPVINLNSNEKLILEFDYLGGASKQFRVEVSHQNKDWQRSPLPPDFYMRGFNETYFSSGLASFSQQPSYTHYSFEFPGSQLSFKTSGNYLLSVYDYEDNSLLFSLPFFVSENKGTLNTCIQALFAQRQDLRSLDQPFSTYRYPVFVEFPQFDLSFRYVQNQLWGRTKSVDFFDTSAPGEVSFHLAREKAFLGNYEFNTIDLRGLAAAGQTILEVQKGITPPKVILRRDVQAFSPAPRFSPAGRFGLPADDRSSSYASVRFSLETSKPLSADQKIYLVGDFNNWMINDLNRMQLNSHTGLWEGEAFIKEGEYSYKYVLVSQDKIDDISLDRSFRFVRQNYLTFVYYKDPTRNFDRLLKVISTIGD